MFLLLLNLSYPLIWFSWRLAGFFLAHLHLLRQRKLFFSGGKWCMARAFKNAWKSSPASDRAHFSLVLAASNGLSVIDTRFEKSALRYTFSAASHLNHTLSPLSLALITQPISHYHRAFSCFFRFYSFVLMFFFVRFLFSVSKCMFRFYYRPDNIFVCLCLCWFTEQAILQVHICENR